MEKKSQYFFNIICLFIFGFIQIVDSETWGSCLLKPSTTSGWTSMIAQDISHSQISLEHAFQEWPAYVDIQVKPANQSGSNVPFVFPGIGSAQRDDDENIPYGGIVYIYDKNSVILFAPNKNDGFNSGAAIYTGNSEWKGPSSQNNKAVEVRIRAWKTQDFPKPDFVSNWTKITAGRSTGSYLEIKHLLNREPEFVSVQVKLGNTEFISDGVGSDTKLSTTSNQTKWGGVIHAYDNNTVRIWTPNSLGGGIFSATDGWGKNNQGQFYTDGMVRVRVWSKLASQQHAKTVTHVGLTGVNDSSTQLTSLMRQNTDLLKVTLKTKDAPNKNFHFLASGAVQNIQSNQNAHSSGLVYAYSDLYIKYWYPSLQAIGSSGHGYVVYLNNKWGNVTSDQKSTTVDLETNIWKPHSVCPSVPPSTLKKAGAHPDRPTHTIPNWFRQYMVTSKYIPRSTIATRMNGSMYDQKPSAETTGISATIIAVIVVVLLLILGTVAGIAVFMILKKKKQNKRTEPEGNEQQKDNVDEKKPENVVKSTISLKSTTNTQTEENIA